MNRSAAPRLLVVPFFFAAAASFAAFTPVAEKGTVMTSDFGEVPKEIIWSDDGARMVLIPAGTYRIGTGDASLPGYGAAEGPEVTVTVGSYYIDVLEVEYDQYMKVAQAAGLQQPTGSVTRAGANAAGLPVAGIPWESASGYAAAVRRALPTEAEWEIAGRGAEANLYPWGTAPKEGAVLGRGSTALPDKVGSAAVDVSVFGVRDLAGNVSEWTVDYYDRAYYSKVAGQTAPQITAAADSRAIRGGSYYSKIDGRLTTRLAGVPNQSREEVGFRTVYRLVKAEPTPVPTPTPIAATPTPSATDRTQAMREILAPMLSAGTFTVPSEYDAFATLSASVPVMNRTPFEARMAGVSLDEGRIYFLSAPVPSGETGRLALPADTLVHLFAWAKTPAGERVVSLGPVNEAGGALLTLEVNTFSPVRTDDEKILESPDSMTAKQTFAGGYYPQWNELLLFNSSTLPLEFSIGAVQRDGSAAERFGSVLMAGELMLVKSLEAGKLRMTAHYVGGRDEVQSNIADFAIDDKADLRMFTFSQAAKGDKVRVVAKEEFPIEIVRKDVSLPVDIRNRYLPGGKEGAAPGRKK